MKVLYMVLNCFLFVGLCFCQCKLSVSAPCTAAVSFPGPGTKPDIDKASKKSLVTKSQIPKTLKVLLGLGKQTQITASAAAVDLQHF